MTCYGVTVNYIKHGRNIQHFWLIVYKHVMDFFGTLMMFRRGEQLYDQDLMPHSRA